MKSTDITLKYEVAKQCFDDRKYSRAIVLLKEAVPLMKGTEYGEKSLYLLAQSYYAQKNYASAAEYFKNYYILFPRGKYIESACFYSAYSLYLESPDVRFDQSDTYKAMQQFQDFLKSYPHNKEIVQNALVELQEKLALKELIAVRLYYNLGGYTLCSFPESNYLACVITAQNALQSYPYSKYREDFMYYIFKAKYKIALQSIEEKKDFRYHDAIKEYYSYTNEYLSGRYLKEIQKLYNNIDKRLNVKLLNRF